MRGKTLGINVRVTENEKEKLLQNANYCSLSLSECLRRSGLVKEVEATIRERYYRIFRLLNQLKTEIEHLEKDEMIHRIDVILNELN